MSLTRIFAIVLRQYYLTRDNATRLLQIFLWPFLDILLWGFLSQYLEEISSTSFIPILLGAIILWDFLSRVMTGVTMTFFEDVWSNNFLNMFASPLSISEYVAGMIASSIGTSAIGFVGMLLAGSVLFGFSITMYGLMSLPFLLILFLSGISLGIFGVALVLRYGPSAEWFIWPLPAIVAPFVGVFYPIETLPQWMQYVGQALPPTYVFEGVRAIVAGENFDSSSLLIGSMLGLFCIALSYAFFVRIYHRAVRTGLIAKYSAESAA
ncbi:ABC transporter [Candidatus Kaiserbacteria bacterium RIFCSPHIGHO2_01_FULL_56_24]|uniref:Transport permease protein n=1 Tax=Candidatus Kaiserbacteria bacterium RIFCSPHIGHO2_01_FULL_56_24 TaxID=1798487 RepID=A0A1F6DGB3_9BACT|nr:MAG: ABC transporter [Candidatus Kaiserbacteria bacterium RIFCSPHIGHO2_01_FULL_56_24]